MGAPARRLDRDEEKRGLAGLLHDIDAELTEGNPEIHTLKAEELLKDYSLDPDILDP